ncbi:amidase [Bordetella sp. BOR01]|uniref:amidase n=1 Tax=Bordetella sp. BOR01 TaxID=2854779 RepID=UPI001C492C8F|nr:amidase [Bordetella sp. BOR01]MBV7481822.1 amidase [Bordetella sp. BOR01]
MNQPLDRAIRFRSAVDITEGSVAGSSTAQLVLHAQLEQIALREPVVKAWSFHNPDAVLQQATRAPQNGRNAPLDGVTVGVKDIIDTRDMPTAYGSPIYRGHMPASDAEVIRRLQAAGAVIMGKTVTTEFAYVHPGPTVNPLNPEHTPGGSSSGSAAAVADGMCTLALGSQTGGSTIRPAAYCGVVGYKPTRGIVPSTGMKPLAPSMDTVGLFARSAGDVAVLFAVLSANAQARQQTAGPATRRIGFYPGPYADQADMDAHHALERARQRLIKAGYQVEPIDLPLAVFIRMSECNRTIMAYEAARALAAEFKSHHRAMSEAAKQLVERGRRIQAPVYQEALALAAEGRRALAQALEGYDCLMTFSAPGEAPRLTTGTGDSVFNRTWTTIGAPCITLPFGLGQTARLPIGIQLVDSAGNDLRLLNSARRIEQALLSHSH